MSVDQFTAEAPAAEGMKKRCPTCSRWLPVDAFGVARSRPDGRQGECRECRRERQRSDKGHRRRNRPPGSGYHSIQTYVSDDVGQLAREFARRRGESLSALVERGIRAELSRLVNLERARR